MVSSFIIKTTVKVPLSYREEINKIFEDFRVSKLPSSTRLQRFYDSGDDFVDYMEKYGNGKHWYASPSDVDFFDEQNWRVNSDGTLYDCSEKFYYSLTFLQYFIDTYFEPKGIKLNGKIAGVNTEHPNGFVFEITDNKIVFLSEHTSYLIDELSELYEENSYVPFETLNCYAECML